MSKGNVILLVRTVTLIMCRYLLYRRIQQEGGNLILNLFYLFNCLRYLRILVRILSCDISSEFNQTEIMVRNELSCDSCF